MSSLRISGRSGSRYLRWGLIVLPVIIPVLFLQIYFSGNWYAITHPYSLAMVFGLFSYSMFCIILIMSTRVRLLDRLFGHDRILRIHGYFAFLSISSAVIHYLLKSGYLEKNDLQSAIGMVCLVIFLTVMLITITLMTSGLPFTVPLLSSVRSTASKRFGIDYSFIKLLHNIFSLAVVFLLIHVFIASSTQESLPRMSFIGIIGGAALIRYLFHKFIRPYSNRKTGYTLVNVDNPSDNIVRLTAATHSGKKVSFLPGQFCYLKIPSKETGNEEHPFTLSSASEDPDIQITVKKLGNYTSQLVNIRKSTPVVLDGPYGTFTPSADGHKKVFIAGGIGITPFRSILASWFNSKEDIPETVLLWSVKRASDLIDVSFFEKTADECSWFSFIPILTRERNEKYGHGRITPEQIADVCASSTGVVPDIYLCGPASMIRHLYRQCRLRGVPRKNIHFELFSF